MAHERILVVDDNPSSLKLARVLLTVVGYEVRTAVDAAEALGLVASFLPRLILVDLQLPGMDGLELTRRIKGSTEANGAPVVVAVTARATTADERAARDAGCDGYLRKPIDTRTLPALVARFLAGSGPGAAQP